MIALVNILFESFSPFNFNIFAKLTSLSDMKKYAREKLGKPKLMGQGSSREVYRLSSTKVLKIARHEGGILQNQAESATANTKYTIKVYRHDSEFNWIVCEIARTLNPYELLTYIGIKPKVLKLCRAEEFLDLFDKTWDEIVDLLVSRRNSFGARLHLTQSTPREIADWIVKNKERLHDFFVFLSVHGIETYDLNRNNQWGRTADGRIVLVDFGYTETNSNSVQDAIEDARDFGTD